MTVKSFPTSYRAHRAAGQLAESRDRVFRAACALNAVADMARLSGAGRDQGTQDHCQHLGALFELVGEYLMDTHQIVHGALHELGDRR